MGERRDWLTCTELVELVTEYFEGALDAERRRRFERHLAACPPCRVYLMQLRETIASVGRLREDDVPDAAREELLTAFRDWHAQSE